jgi:hypothetical protein
MSRLEQSCVRPGLWLIEGRTVRRITPASAKRTKWQIEYFGRIAYAATLERARELILSEVSPENYGR